MLATVIVAMASAFITGALARFAVPGPDPMPAWLTIAIGLLGTAIGTGIVIAVDGRRAGAAGWAGIASFLAAIVLVVLYRRFVQKRALWGPEAYRFPERGVGVEHARERLKRAGIDPDQIGVGMPFGVGQPLQPVPGAQPAAAGAAGPAAEATDNPAHYLGLLEELHDAGVLDDDQFSSARTRLLERLRG
jgi:uncharacterized membrane protein YeaQ/YmgE (transglycosylase-associated protein family)